MVNNEEMDRAMFSRLHNLLVDQKAFLVAGLSRDQVMKATFVPKNKFAYLFREFTGQSYKSFLNTLRLDYAANLLLEHPEYTVETVAQESGISKPQTFYRLFMERYHITPSQYRLNPDNDTMVDED